MTWMFTWEVMHLDGETSESKLVFDEQELLEAFNNWHRYHLENEALVSLKIEDYSK